MKYTFSFKEVNYGSITIEADHRPDGMEVEQAISEGNAFYKNTQYEDIFLEEELNRPKAKRDFER